MKVESIERTYSHYAGVYDLVFDRILQPGRRESVLALDPQPGDRALEIGIGTGLSVPYYPTHCNITGIDISAPMLREAEKKRDADYPLHQLDLMQMDATHLEFPDDHFDGVLASYVLSAVPEPETVLEEIIRVARSGARIVIVNHFRSGFSPVAAGEKLIRPLSWKLGFRLDLPLEMVTEHPLLQVETIQRVNLLGRWKVVVARALPAGGGDASTAGR
jgi:phosphatidylethanolamine/phosphatidyl-N-methylethanolamine N-methyltransferase